MPEMILPDEVHSIFAAVATKFRDLHKGSDDDRREATKRGIQTIKARLKFSRAELNPDRWVHKTQHSNGAAPSKDAIAFVPEGPIESGRRASMFMFDMINGTSREPNPPGIHGELGEQYIIDHSAQDWLETDGPIPLPDPKTHKYLGGGNDTGICDVCGKPRLDPVHAIEDSKRKHKYEGGEQDTGQCDICQKAKDDPIHKLEPPVEKHAFEGTGGFCSECGKLTSDPIHDMTPVPQPGGGGVDAEIKDLLRQILASSKAQEQKLDALRSGMIDFGKQILDALVTRGDEKIGPRG